MTTTQLIKLLKEYEYGAATGKPREIYFCIGDQIIETDRITIGAAGDGIFSELFIKIKQSWIPCSERLPENKAVTYWICTDTGYQCECRWTNVSHFWAGLTMKWHWHIMDIPQYSKVIAWMPLPECYKDGDENGKND